MTKHETHPVYGVLSKEEFLEAMKCSAGGALNIIQERDPLWGKTISIDNLKKHKCRVTRTVSVNRKDFALVVIEATDKNHAKEILNDMDWCVFDWKEGFYEEDDLWRSTGICFISEDAS